MQQMSLQTCCVGPVLLATVLCYSISWQQPVGTDHWEREFNLNLRFMCVTFNYLRMLAPDVSLGMLCV